MMITFEYSTGRSLSLGISDFIDSAINSQDLTALYSADSNFKQKQRDFAKLILNSFYLIPFFFGLMLFSTLNLIILYFSQ